MEGEVALRTRELGVFDQRGSGENDRGADDDAKRDLQQGTAEGGDDDALAAGAEGHAHANLTRSPGDGKRQHGVDPGQRQDEGDAGQHDRDAQPQPHHPQDVAVGLVGALHVDEPQGWIDGHGQRAHLRRERHRIAAAHVHHHMNLIEQIRRGWKVEARGAPGLRRRADAELAHDADHFVPVTRSRGIVRVPRRPAP